MDSIKVTPQDIASWVGNLEVEFAYMVLSAFRIVTAKAFEIQPEKVVLSFTKNFRQHLKLRKIHSPPYIVLGVNRITPRRDQLNIPASLRSGLHAPFDEQIRNQILRDTPAELLEENQWVQEISPVPIEIEVQITYVDSDVRRIMTNGMRFQNAVMAKKVNFSVDAGLFDTTVAVQSDDLSLTAPAPDGWVELEDDAAINLQAFQFLVKIPTYNFVLRKVPTLIR